MTIVERLTVNRIAVVLVMILMLGVPGEVGALEVGEAAPGFTLPSTTGSDISLSDFKGKRYVLLEFYGADFAPT